MLDPISTELHYVMEIEPIDLGAGVKAVSLDLMEVESREPAVGSAAGKIWAFSLAAIAAADSWNLDFFAHLDRVRDYCKLHAISCEERVEGRLIVIPQLTMEPLADLIERFSGETFGARLGSALDGNGDGTDSELARSGVDAYHAAFRNYLCCAVCDFENGFLTLLTEKLWTSEVIRRVKPAVAHLAVEVGRPQ